VSEATAEQTRGRRKTLIGTVVSVKMEKTAVVAVERRYPHPLYHKIVRKTKRYKVHDPNNSAVLGDYVRIEETRPISKEKRWRIAETMTRGNVADLQPREIGLPEEAAPTRQAPTTAAAASETPRQAENATPDMDVEARQGAAGSASEASRDETPMSTDSTVLEAAADDMDVRDYEAGEESQA
jgi:small subunit ribosomal protein S17